MLNDIDDVEEEKVNSDGSPEAAGSGNLEALMKAMMTKVEKMEQVNSNKRDQF